MEAFRLVMAIATTLDWDVHQMDVKTAFLNGVLPDNLHIYMKQPAGAVIPGQEHKVCRLIKSLYGLKQAPRVWYLALHAFLLELGFSRCLKEYCIYTKKVGDEWIMIIVYVDDLTIASKSSILITELKKDLSTRFKMSDLGPIHYMLKIQVERDRENKLTILSQEKYIKDLLREYDMTDCKPVATPQDVNEELVPETTLQGEDVFKQPYKYRNLVGSLQYLVRGSRPDLANAVRELSKFLTSYNSTHWQAALRILKYLKGTSTHGLVYDGKIDKNIMYQIYTDASFGNKNEGRKSVTGYVSMMAGACISSRSVKQDNVTISTSEAELVAASEGARESAWLWYLLEELGFPQKEPVRLWYDNTAAIAVIKNPANHKANKHIEIRHLYTRALHEKGQLDVQYCSTHDMIADIFTKALPTKQFSKLRNMLGVKEIMDISKSKQVSGTVSGTSTEPQRT